MVLQRASVLQREWSYNGLTTRMVLQRVWASIWLDESCIVYHELVQPRQTINGECYKQVLIDLNNVLKQKCTEYFERHDQVLFQHDNAHPHVAKPLKETLEALGCNFYPTCIIHKVFLL